MAVDSSWSRSRGNSLVVARDSIVTSVDTLQISWVDIWEEPFTIQRDVFLCSFEVCEKRLARAGERCHHIDVTDDIRFQLNVEKKLLTFH